MTQFALVSTIMPHTNRRLADNYRWALLVSGAGVIVFTVTGLLPAAIASAALLLPLTYVVYLYDVNLWQDAPVPVAASLFLFTGGLAALLTLIFFRWVFDAEFLSLVSQRIPGVEEPPLGAFLLFTILLPILAEVVKNLAPLWLATRRQFDDMIDGLTFGIVAGSAYAAAETIVAFLPVFSGEVRTTQGLGVWFPVVLNLMLVKPLIYGTATGLAVAAFSGLGEGYDGFTRKYVANLAAAAGMNALYWLGVRLLSTVAFGQALGLLWGLAILAVLVMRIRVVLHAALLEAALEAAAHGGPAKGMASEGGVCPECEMPLVARALFCTVCGESVRATSNKARDLIRKGSAGPS